VITKASHRLRGGEDVVVDFALTSLENIPSINLSVLYEDDDCVVIDKPVGLLVHSKGAFNPEATVATWLQERLTKGDNWEPDAVNNRVGIVHRLDRATSGVMICAKNQVALSWLQKQFSQRKVKKTYIAIVKGTLDPAEAIIDMPIERNPKQPATFRVGSNGKHATTHYKVVEDTNGYSLVELRPETGRTHQLRVHLAQRGHPIIGDTLYDGTPAERLYLHAHELELTLPSRERKIFTSPVPQSFNDLLNHST
jgi:23S rRNA pseudouridine1911/1915/1917 synthase